VTLLVGEGFAGDGAHVAHVGVVVGEREGPVGIASASALASPSPGHTPFVVMLRTFVALCAAREDRPRPEDVLAAGEPRNPYFPA